MSTSDSSQPHHHSLSSPHQPLEGACERLSQAPPLLCPQPSRAPTTLSENLRPRAAHEALQDLPGLSQPPFASPVSPAPTLLQKHGLPAVPPTHQTESCPKAFVYAVRSAWKTCSSKHLYHSFTQVQVFAPLRKCLPPPGSLPGHFNYLSLCSPLPSPLTYSSPQHLYFTVCGSSLTLVVSNSF